MGLFLLALYTMLDFKGVWVPRWSIDDKNAIFDVLDNRFNHIFLQIFALGEAYYPSKYAPSKMKSDRWLRDFIQEAHQRNIKVSAWINVFYSWGFAPLPKDPFHPINRQPNWYVRDAGDRTILEYSIEELKELQTEGYYLAPANDQVQTYIINIAQEIITNYDFDGIHLDYIRYPTNDFVYDGDLRTAFMRKYYVDPLDLVTDPGMANRYGVWGHDELITSWRIFVNNDLTYFIQRFNQSMKSIDPGLLISAAVKPNHVTARYDHCQDWLVWLNSGFIDFVCLMAYGKNIRYNLNKLAKVVHDPYRVTVGLGIYALTPEQISEQVRQVKSRSFSGVVFFSYDKLKENRAYLDALKY